MSEYVPTMVRLRSEYVEMRAQHYGFSDLYAEEWDRAIAAHDRQVKAEAWDEAVEAMAWAQQNGPEQHWLPYVRDNSPYRAESQETP